MIPNLVSASDDDITIFHTNDMHGSVSEFLEYVKTAKGSTPNSMLLDDGDAVQGVALATYSQGFAIIALYGGTYNGKNVCRMVNTNLGNLVADSMVEEVKELVANMDYSDNHIVSMINGGGIRSTIYPDAITMDDVVSVLPFGNTLSVKSVTPDLLYDIIEQGISSAAVTNGALTVVSGFPNVGGMRYEYTINSGSDNTVDAIYLSDEDGNDIEKLDRNDTTTEILFSASSILTGGGDGYDMLTTVKHVAEGNSLDVYLGAYLKQITEAHDGTFYIPSGADVIDLTEAKIAELKAASIASSTGSSTSSTSSTASPFTSTASSAKTGDELLYFVIPAFGLAIAAILVSIKKKNEKLK